jgi:hypothetical protein
MEMTNPSSSAVLMFEVPLSSLISTLIYMSLHGAQTTDNSVPRGLVIIRWERLIIRKHRCALSRAFLGDPRGLLGLESLDEIGITELRPLTICEL